MQGKRLNLCIQLRTKLHIPYEVETEGTRLLKHNKPFKAKQTWREKSARKKLTGIVRNFKNAINRFPANQKFSILAAKFFIRFF